EKGIPEFQFISEQDWLDAAKGELRTEEDYRQALGALRNSAANKFIQVLKPALADYLEANKGKFPTDMAQLKSYFESPVEDAVLQRWEIIPADKLPNLTMGGDWIISQK